MKPKQALDSWDVACYTSQARLCDAVSLPPASWAWHTCADQVLASPAASAYPAERCIPHAGCRGGCDAALARCILISGGKSSGGGLGKRVQSLQPEEAAHHSDSARAEQQSGRRSVRQRCQKRQRPDGSVAAGHGRGQTDAQQRRLASRQGPRQASGRGKRHCRFPSIMQYCVAGNMGTALYTPHTSATRRLLLCWCGSVPKPRNRACRWESCF